MKNVLSLFGEETKKWFQETLGAPTLVQQAAWPSIAAGGHVLVSAPTGFFWDLQEQEKHFQRF